MFYIRAEKLDGTKKWGTVTADVTQSFIERVLRERGYIVTLCITGGKEGARFVKLGSEKVTYEIPDLEI
jgi:uncharacterized protein YebE (UPF0316 family)